MSETLFRLFGYFHRNIKIILKRINKNNFSFVHFNENVFSKIEIINDSQKVGFFNDILIPPGQKIILLKIDLFPEDNIHSNNIKIKKS